MKEIPYLEFGAGPLLHFAHANGFPPGTYRQFLGHLGASYRVLAMAQRPLWPDEPPEQLDGWHQLAGDLIRFLDEHGAQGIVGAGHSLGAVVTMVAALERPDLFRKLVLIEPVFLPPPLLAAAAAHPEKAFEIPLVHIARRRRHRWPSREAAFAHFRKKAVFARFSDTALGDYVEYGLEECSDGVELRYSREWEARFYGTPPLQVWEQIPRIEHPTLAVRGEATDTLMAPAWELWQELQPGAHFVEIGDAGHLAPMEKPAKLTTVVAAFLDNV
ncbi:MAG: alpha/beta hydrolase [Anaerolineae bacterium]|nr:alpha/beta hydrolase [Anaerolineae bacterium]